MGMFLCSGELLGAGCELAVVDVLHGMSAAAAADAVCTVVDPVEIAEIVVDGVDIVDLRGNSPAASFK